MIKLNYSENQFKVKEENGKEVIFDSLRKIWVRLTPEEWVRQNFLKYLIINKNYPSALIAVEKEIHLGELKKRFDILIYNAEHQPWMMIECKAMDIALDENVFHQVLRYNMSVPVRFLVITNGTNMIVFERTSKGLEMLYDLPSISSQ